MIIGKKNHQAKVVREIIHKSLIKKMIIAHLLKMKIYKNKEKLPI